MENYKNILPSDVFHVISKGVTCELCVADRNFVNFNKFSDFLVDNISAGVHYCYVIHFELHDDGLLTTTGGFKLKDLEYESMEKFYSFLIDAHNNSYTGNDIINHVNISFYPYDAILRLLELKTNVGL